MSQESAHTNVYIDGFNLYFGSLYDNPQFKWLDLRKLASNLSPNTKIGEIYYFTAQIKSRYHGDSAPNRQNYYLRLLRETGIQVVVGNFRKATKYSDFASSDPEKITRPSLAEISSASKTISHNLFEAAKPDLPQAFVSKFEEKGSDVNLASYLLRDVYQNQLKRAMVITGDTDQITPIKFSREHGVFIDMVIPNRSNSARAFEQHANYVHFIDDETLLASQFDEGITFKSGKIARRPLSWT